MGDSGGRLDQEDEAERRISRARAAIGKSFEELINRGGADAPDAPAAGEPPTSPRPPDPAADAELQVGEPATAGERVEVEALIAAVDSRVSAAEAALRSRLRAEIDVRSSEQKRLVGEEVAAFRKRINEELADALQSTATELRRQLDADREGARREFSDSARNQIEQAVGRLDQLRAAAVRDARQAAEEVATSRIADARSEIAEQFESSRARSTEGIDRGLSGLDSQLKSMFMALREEHEAAGSAQQEEARRRNEDRIDELASELSMRIEREVRRRLDEVRGELERANAESADLMRTEAIAGAEMAIQREIAKGEARLAATTVDADLERRAAESVEVHATAFRDELARTDYRDHSRQAEAAAAAQLARSLDALKLQRAELAADLARIGEDERGRSGAQLANWLSAAKDELDRRLAELLQGAELALSERVDALVAARFEPRAAALERRLETLVDGAAGRTLSRFTAAASAAEGRLAAVEHAQRREEEVRARIHTAERAAEGRVREAERRLVEVLGRIASVERRG